MPRKSTPTAKSERARRHSTSESGARASRSPETRPVSHGLRHTKSAPGSTRKRALDSWLATLSVNGEDDDVFWCETRLWPALLSAVVLSTTAVILSPSAVAKWSGTEPCVSASGMTLKQQYGYSVAV